jgi:uncharacterized cupredoxin-like copper-binding protein
MPGTITRNGNDSSRPTTVEELVVIDEHLGRTEARLVHVEEEVRRQGTTAKRVQQGFAIFAFFALLIAGVNLIVVATKLDNSSSATATPKAKAAAPAPALPHSVGATLKEFSVNVTTSQAASGRVSFRVHNSGTVTHELVVVRSDQPAGKLPLKNGRADEAGNVGETGDLAPGASKTVALNLKSGHYALICNLPGHYGAGQYRDLTVK